MSKRKQDTAVDAQADVAAGEKVVWYPSSIKPRGIVALVTGMSGSCVLGWGDLHYTATAGGAPPVSHVYASAGAYKLTVYRDAESGEDGVHLPGIDALQTLVVEQQVYVRDGLTPDVTFGPASDNPNIIEATINDEPADLASKYSITWDVGGTAEEFFGPKGTVKPHGYQAGEHTITVRDLHTRRVLREVVTVTDPVYDPDFTVAKGANTMTATLTISKLDTPKEILVDWGDGDQDTLPSPTLGDTISHEYLDAESYIVQMVYSDGSTDGSAKLVTVPFPA